MKSLYISFEDEEFKRFKEAKDKSKLSWKKFILKNCVRESILDTVGKWSGRR